MTNILYLLRHYEYGLYPVKYLKYLTHIKFSGKKLEDGKGIGGRGRLTAVRIDAMQNFYGKRTIKVMLLPCQRLPRRSLSITPAPQKILGMKTALVEMSHGAVPGGIWPLNRQHIVPYKIPYLRQ